MTYTNILEVVRSQTGKLYASLVQIEPNGLRHAMFTDRPVSGPREANALAKASQATVKLVEG
jgi:hypothetical protein